MVRRVVALGLSFALFTLQPTLGGAAVVEQTFSKAAITVSGPIVTIHDYTNAGATASWTSQSDFDAGTFTATNSVDSEGSIVLNRIGPDGVVAPTASIPWWDTAWNNRRCFAVDHSAVDATSVTEYQMRLDFPLEALTDAGFLQPDFGDLRAVGSDQTTSLPLWIDDTTPDTVWVQMDSITATEVATLCMYYGHGTGTTAPTNHNEAAVFTHTTPKPIYFTVSDRYADPGSPIDIVSYIDANEVTIDGDPPLAIDLAGDRLTVDAATLSPGLSLSVLGPLAAAGVGEGFDTLVPISFAGTEFVVPIERGTQHFSFVAPFAEATVNISNGAAPADSFTVTPGTPYVHTTMDVTAGNAALIDSDVPVLVTHAAATGGDAIALYPATSGDFFGIRSTELLIGYNTDGTAVTVTTSDAATVDAPGDRGDTTGIGGGDPQGGGAADAVQLTSDQPISVVIHEDSDGTESAIALPRQELNSRYWLPADAQYVAAACPTEESTAIELTITAPETPPTVITCGGSPTIGWAQDATGWATTAERGVLMEAADEAPFFAYYETAADHQVNALGMKQGRQYTWPAPVVTAGPDEGLYETTGLWESETYDAGPGGTIFGSLRLDGEVPADTSLRLQVATSATGTPDDYVGPDGTAGSYFTPTGMPAVLDFGHDGERLLRIRAEFATSDPVTATPRFDAVAVDHDLAALQRSLGSDPILEIDTALDPASATAYLLRVRTSDPRMAGSTAAMVIRSESNLGNLASETVRFVDVARGLDSVQQSTSQPAEAAVAFDPLRPHSVVIDSAALASGVTEVGFAWQLNYRDSGSIYLETDFVVEITAP